MKIIYDPILEKFREKDSSPGISGAGTTGFLPLWNGVSSLTNSFWKVDANSNIISNQNGAFASGTLISPTTGIGDAESNYINLYIPVLAGGVIELHWQGPSDSG